jgi:hypothetical protein
LSIEKIWGCLEKVIFVLYMGSSCGSILCGYGWLSIKIQVLYRLINSHQRKKTLFSAHLIIKAYVPALNQQHKISALQLPARIELKFALMSNTKNIHSVHSSKISQSFLNLYFHYKHKNLFFIKVFLLSILLCAFPC